MDIKPPNSAHRACAILMAWESGDLPRFQLEVDAVDALSMSDAGTNEMERIDLLSGVVGKLRGTTLSSDDPSQQVCRDLLRHLAGHSPARLRTNGAFA